MKGSTGEGDQSFQLSQATRQLLSPCEGGTGCSLKARLSNELCKPEVPSSGPKGMELIPSSVLEQPHPQAILSGVLNSSQSLVAILPASEVKGVGRRWRERLAAPPHYYGKVSTDYCQQEWSLGMEKRALPRLYSHPSHCVCVHVCVCTPVHAGVRTGPGCCEYPSVSLRQDHSVIPCQPPTPCLHVSAGGRPARSRPGELRNEYPLRAALNQGLLGVGV